MDLRMLVGPVPSQLRFTSGKSEVLYELAEDVVAAHGVNPCPSTLMRLEGERINVEPVARVADRRREVTTIGPVYRRTPSGGLVVPTGRVFVRFEQGDSAADHKRELAAAGYEVVDIAPYAPHAAWLRPVDGTIGDGLAHLDRIERLSDVEHVEPQLLGAPGARD